MTKGIFDSKAGSGYDDEITQRYHFPRRYLQAAQGMAGDWVIYREPTRGRRGGYVAVARVARIDPDPERAGHFYARVDSFLALDRAVPLREDGRYHEADLRAAEGASNIGWRLQGRSVRPVSDVDFAAIVLAGLNATLAPANAIRLGLDAEHADADTLALVNAPPEVWERQVVRLLLNRKVRDASFRRQVCDAYDNTCAVTGLQIVNGGGRAEAQAAHIWAVRDGGSDVVQNGIALSGTVHWLFDRHLISLTDDYRLLVSHNKVPAELRGLFGRHSERICLPADQRLWPNQAFIGRHRTRSAG